MVGDLKQRGRRRRGGGEALAEHFKRQSQQRAGWGRGKECSLSVVKQGRAIYRNTVYHGKISL